MQMLDAIRLLCVLLVAFTIAYFLWQSVRLARLSKRASQNIGSRRYDEAIKDYAALDRMATRLKLKMNRDAYAFIAAHGQGVVLNLQDRCEEALGFLRRAQELLDQGVHQSEMVKCNVLCETARCYFAIGRTHSADKLLAQAEKACSATSGDERIAVLEQMRSEAEGACARNHFPIAKRLLAFVMKACEWDSTLDGTLAMNARVSLSQVHVMQGEYGQARESLSLVLDEASAGSVSDQTRESAWLTLGNLDMIEGNLLSSIGYQQKLLTLKHENHAASWDLANAEMSLANSLRIYGDYRQALKHARQASSAVSTLPQDDGVALAVSCQASIHMLDAGEYQEADRLFARVENNSHELVRRKGAVRYVSLLIRSLYYRDLLRFDEAYRTGREALSIAESIHGIDHHMTSEFRMILAATMTRLGQLTEAAATLEGVASAFAKKTDLTFFSRMDLLQAQTELSLAQGNIDEAERQSRMSLELLTPRVLPSSFELATAHRFLGVALSLKGSHDLAIEQFSTSELIRLTSMPQTHPRFIPLYDDWAEALNRMGRTDEAVQRESQADGVRKLCKAYP